MDGPGKFVPTNPRLQPPKKKPESSPESNYWRSFKTRQLTLHASPPPMSPSSTSPLLLPTTSFSPPPSPSLSSLHPPSPISSITDFPDVAFSRTFRSDGKLIAAGCQSGVVQVFNAASRLALRRLEGHAHPAWYPLASSGDKLHLLSAGDDALVKWWDVSTSAEVLTLTGHRDYVRSGSPSPAAAHLWATGSYDHTVKVWDIRRPESSVLSVNHGAPVEAVLFLPSGGWMATAGANSVKIWDIIGGRKMVHSMENHKTVTALSLGKISSHDGVESTRIFSVSLDRYLKVFDHSNFKVTHTSRFPFPLLSVDSSPSSLVRAIGTAIGIAFVSKRKNTAEADGDSAPGGGAEGLFEEKKRASKPRGLRYFERGQSEKPSEGDFLVKKPEKVKLAEHDQLLKKFRHK